MPMKNPTSFEFHASVSQVHDALRKMSVRPSRVIELASDSNTVWGREILRKPENSLDAFARLYARDSSRIFYRRENIIPYWYAFHIHITEKEKDRTLVEIRTINPRIGIGTRFPYNILPWSEPNKTITREVEPSTIEEYMILLEIGKELGQRERMPPLIMPERGSRAGGRRDSV
jgi:hypothetical protein